MSANEVNLNHSSSYVLEVTEGALQLKKAKSILFSEFLRGPIGYRRRLGGGLKESIAKAVGLKSLHDNKKVLDATAGLGEDAFILASLGCSVHLIERSPIIAALLQDGLERALQDPPTAPIIRRMKITIGDSIKILKDLPEEERPEIIYLDPMFPQRQKSALTKLSMRFIRDIVGADYDTEQLLTQALLRAKKRVVVKRPKGAAPVMNKTPNHYIDGKGCRFDVYLIEC